MLSPTLVPLVQARALFAGGRGYLAACSMGLPTRETVTAMTTDAAAWAAGKVSPAGYGAVAERVRALYARIVGVGVDRVAIGSQVSVIAAMVAASVPDNAEVICVDGDFSSMVFPFLAQMHRGVRVRHLALDQLAAGITDATWLVAFSLVQSATGQVADSGAIVTAARRHQVRTFCDTTQAAGWLPIDASVFDATACHSYKWLCAPRGAAFLTVSERFQAELRPVQAGWYAGDDVWASCYGPRMQLSPDARRFDVSPAWPAWPGAEAALTLFAALDLTEVHDYDVGLGDALCEGLGIPTAGQAIVTWPDSDGEAVSRLNAAGITASRRAGRARVAFHLWNDRDDVADVLRALGRQ
jgi:selenocysteine lyase/cysteine desulfurase